jgi:hypothetical protein
MKKVLFSLLVFLLSVSYLNAQFTKVGGGAGFTTGYYFHEMNYDYNKSGHIFASFKGIYEITVPIHVSPSFTIFIPHVVKEAGLDQKTTVNTMMFDINGHYVFNSLDKMEFYALAGLDILLAFKRDKYAGSPAYKESDNAFGLNIGAGTYFKLTEQFDIYGEAKYLLSKYDQFMFNVGVLVNIDWLIKHENTGL